MREIESVSLQIRAISWLETVSRITSTGETKWSDPCERASCKGRALVDEEIGGAHRPFVWIDGLDDHLLARLEAVFIPSLRL